MQKLRAIWKRFLSIFTMRRIGDEFEIEIQNHIAEQMRDGVRSGLNETEARRQALLQLGGVEQARQAYRDRATLPWMESLLRDARYALRGFRRNPVFAVTAILTLALGIGATTAVFSVVDRILFRSLPYAHPEQLVSVGLTAPIIPREFVLGGSYYQWQDNQTPFTALSSYTGADECDLTERNPQRLNCATVEQNFLPTLGISPVLGRNFLPDEDAPHGPRVALISYGLWASQYGRDPTVVNRLIDVDTHQVRVIGVLPRDFEMPALDKVDILEPEALDKGAERKADPGHVLYAFARLKPGVTITQAMQQLQPVFNYSLSLAPARFRDEVHLRVRSIHDFQVQDARLIAWILLGTVVTVLLIACANVASLLLTRAASRERELAVRFALGARRTRLIQQTLIESMLLSLFGAIVGVMLAEGLLRVFIAIAPSSLPFLAKARIDLRIAGFATGLSLVLGFVFGILPAMLRPRAIALAARTPMVSTRALLRRAMVVLQIAASVILLAAAALFVHSFANLQNQALGMQTHGVMTAGISLNREKYATAPLQMMFFRQAESALRRLPGVSMVAVSDTLPPGAYSHDQIYSVIAVDGRPAPTGSTGGMVAWRWVTPGYFNALDIPIVRGTGFNEAQRDSKNHFIILSSLLAARLFPNQDPIGQRVKPTPNDPWYTIQGVAADVKNDGLNAPDRPEFYRLRRNQIEDWQQAPSAVLILKTSTVPRALAPWVRSQIAQIDPTVPIDIETLSDRVNTLADGPRFETALLSFFAATGLVLALIGLYGVVAFIAVQRTQEIGIRMALGATRPDVLRLILGEGLRLIVIGGVIGLFIALALTRVLQSVLFSVSPHDPASFAAATLLLAIVTLLAIFFPARSAMKTDPMTALRWE